MTATGIQIEPRSTATGTERTRTGARHPYRWGGIAGFAFAGSVIAQNILRGSAPANDAPAAKIIADYTDHRSVHLLLAALFAVGACALPAFVATMWSRLKDGASATFVRIGVLGATGILTLFGLTLALDVALTSYVHLGNPAPDVVKGLWVVHNAVFTILLAALAIALFGLAQAAVAGRLIGTRWKVVGIVAPLALLVPVLAASATTEGSPVLAFGLLGFACWLAFIGRASYALMRETA